ATSASYTCNQQSTIWSTNNRSTAEGHGPSNSARRFETRLLIVSRWKRSFFGTMYSIHVSSICFARSPSTISSGYWSSAWRNGARESGSPLFALCSISIASSSDTFLDWIELVSPNLFSSTCFSPFPALVLVVASRGECLVNGGLGQPNKSLKSGVRRRL